MNAGVYRDSHFPLWRYHPSAFKVMVATLAALLLLLGVVVAWGTFFYEEPPPQAEVQAAARSAYSGAYTCKPGGDCPAEFLCLHRNGQWALSCMTWVGAIAPDWTVHPVTTQDSVQRTAIWIPSKSEGTTLEQEVSSSWVYLPQGKRLTFVRPNGSLDRQEVYLLQSRRITRAWSDRCWGKG